MKSSKAPKPTPTTRRRPRRTQEKTVSFSCIAPDASEVLLAGSFNGWEAGATPMGREPDGSWTLSLELPPGRHEFKFIVDGEWCCDPRCGAGDGGACPMCVVNEHGTMNRVLHVPAD